MKKNLRTVGILFGLYAAMAASSAAAEFNVVDKLTVSGNTGMGTTSPNTQLNMVGGTLQIDGGATNAIIITTIGRLGIGVTNPANALTVAAGASIGSSYVNVTAPSQGLIVQGCVGIGTNSPSYMLDVNGALRATSYVGLSGTVLYRVDNSDCQSPPGTITAYSYCASRLCRGGNSYHQDTWYNCSGGCQGGRPNCSNGITANVGRMIPY